MDGQKGVVIQKDFKTFAIAPHLPCGIVSPEMLRKIADVAQKYHAAAVKVTSAQRIAIIGLKEEDIDAAWKDLGAPGIGRLTGNYVRSVKACPGNNFCKRGRADSLAMGLELDRLYNGMKLPGKMKIGVSGCPNQCAETAIKDIALVAGAKGWQLLVGGNGGTCPRLAKPLLDEEIDDARAMRLVANIIEFFKQHARENERLAETLNRIGFVASRDMILNMKATV
jgi:NAD(P)H-nitrite reductase large subunit